MRFLPRPFRGFDWKGFNFQAPRRLLALILAALVCFSGVFTPLQLHASQTIAVNREYAIKAAFLYHFLTYIEWPAEAPSGPEHPFVIGVYQTDPFGAVLDKISETKNVDGRAIEIRRLQSLEQAETCHVLFVPQDVSSEARNSILSALASSHVLTVGETDDFIDQGGSVQFFLEGNKVRFAFNTEVLGQSGLKVSSKLLSLAKVVSSTSVSPK